MNCKRFASVGIALLAIGAGSAYGYKAPANLSAKQLNYLEANAKTADEYRQLSKYFHYQVMYYSTKAQSVLDEYSRGSSRYPMATKTVTRVEVINRSYEDNIRKVEESRMAAQKYDDLLTSIGFNPEIESSAAVSVKDLVADNSDKIPTVATQADSPVKAIH